MRKNPKSCKEENLNREKQKKCNPLLVLQYENSWAWITNRHKFKPSFTLVLVFSPKNNHITQRFSKKKCVFNDKHGLIDYE